MDLKQLIKEYLATNKMMQLATSINDQPWVCNVWYVADDDMNIYWFSSVTRRHSGEVMKNNKVAAAIVFPQTPQDEGRGLQLQGTATVLEKAEDVEKARSIYERKIFDKETIDELMDDTEKPHKFYRIKPTQFVLFDIKNFPENSRREYNP